MDDIDKAAIQARHDAKPKTDRTTKRDERRPAEKASRPIPGVPHDKEKVKELILKYRGNLTKVALSLGTSRHSLKHTINNCVELTEALDEARERVVDDIEDSFLDKCRAGETTSQIFFLRTRGRARGYAQDHPLDVNSVLRDILKEKLNTSSNPAEHDDSTSSSD